VSEGDIFPFQSMIFADIQSFGGRMLLLAIPSRCEDR
jgi:hypothetical protein